MYYIKIKYSKIFFNVYGVREWYLLLNVLLENLKGKV